MFGERYFATRQKLAAIVHDVRELSRTVDLELDEFSEEGELLQGLRSPFVFVVSGEVNAGKSTLINGLFGEELCKVNVLPETQQVHWYRYGEKERDDEITEVLQERYRPIEFLSDFNIVDTPGTNSVVRGHQAITESFLPVADLVLFVFPVSNPWGAATWDFIARFPEELEGKVAFILQQKDQRDDDELAIIMEHMRQLARQKMGATPDVFAVSGKLAWEAKQRAPFENRLWKESGYPELEAFISKIVTSSPSRRRVLLEVRDATSGVMRKIEEHIDTQATDLERKMRTLRGFETQIDQQRDAYADAFEEKIAELGKVFKAEGEKSLVVLQEHAKPWPSVRALFARDETPGEIEKALTEAVEHAVSQRTDIEATELESLCRQHWEEVMPQIREEIEVEPLPIDDQSVDRNKARARFVRQMARAARQSVVKLKLKGLIEVQLEDRRAVLQRFVAGVLLFLSIGGGLGAFGLNPYSWIAIGVAVLLAVLGYWQAWRSGGRLVRWAEERLERSEETFAEMLSMDYREGMREYFKAYAGLFEAVRRKLLERKAAIKPRQKEWGDLFLELKAIEQEL